MPVYALLLLVVPLLTAVLGAVPAQAQTEAPAGAYLGAARAGYTIYFFGDSLAGGLWAGNIRMTKGNPRITVKGRYKDGSGLSRPRFYDWAKALPPILERNQVDIAVIMIGINDGRPIRLADRQLAVASKEWKEYYQRRVDSVLHVLKTAKVPVYWMQLPPMADLVRDEVSKLITSIQKQRAEAAGVRFVEIRKQFLTGDGAYTDSGEDVEGQFTRLRSRDGVHFIRSGNNKIARIILDTINRDIEISDGTRKPEPSDTIAIAPQSGGISKPIFGRTLNLGETEIIDPRDLPRPDEVTIARSTTTGAVTIGSGIAVTFTTPAETIKNLRDATKPGSAAHTLFAIGNWPETKKGRFDDFSLAVD